MGHTPLMRSRVHPKYKTKYRVSNWIECDRALVQRGSITLWISEDAVASWKPAPSGLRGGKNKFSDHVIEKECGYHLQERVENTFFRYKTIIGPRLRSCHSESQKVEAMIACNILNTMIALGAPESFAIAD
jgi:hypothetical protein